VARDAETARRQEAPMLHDLKLTATTDAGGNATVNADRGSHGWLYAVQVVVGTLAATADLTLSTQAHDGAKTLLTLTNVTADALYYPRDLVHDAAGAALTGTSGGDRALPLCAGVPRLVVAQGGAAKTGSVILFWLD
jgi:hypothetical protein